MFNEDRTEKNAALRGFLQIGVLIGGCGAITAFMLPVGSAEFYVSLCNVGIGLTFIAGVLVLMRLTR